MGLFEDVERKVQEEKRMIREACRREARSNGSMIIGEFSKNFSIGSSSGSRCRKCGARIDCGTLCGACSW